MINRPAAGSSPSSSYCISTCIIYYCRDPSSTSSSSSSFSYWSFTAPYFSHIYTPKLTYQPTHSQYSFTSLHLYFPCNTLPRPTVNHPLSSYYCFFHALFYPITSSLSLYNNPSPAPPRVPFFIAPHHPDDTINIHTYILSTDIHTVRRPRWKKGRFQHQPNVVILFGKLSLSLSLMIYTLSFFFLRYSPLHLYVL